MKNTKTEKYLSRFQITQVIIFFTQYISLWSTLTARVTKYPTFFKLSSVYLLMYRVVLTNENLLKFGMK